MVEARVPSFDHSIPAVVFGPVLVDNSIVSTAASTLTTVDTLLVGLACQQMNGAV